jgi:hypothetical protein
MKRETRIGVVIETKIGVKLFCSAFSKEGTEPV